MSTRGTDYAHLITTGTPGFSDLPTALPGRCILLMLCHVLRPILLIQEIVFQLKFYQVQNLYCKSYLHMYQHIILTAQFLHENWKAAEKIIFSAWPEFELIFMFFGWKYLSFNLLVYFVVIHVINERVFSNLMNDNKINPRF